MTLPPPPALLAGIVLLGWPLLQLVSVLCVRGRRARMRALAADLRRDMADDPQSLRAIEGVVKGSHGDPSSIVFPIVIPLAIVAMSIGELFGRDRPSRADTPEARAKSERMREDLKRQIREAEAARRDAGLWLPKYDDVDMLDPAGTRAYKDDRFRELSSLSFEIGYIRCPVSSILTIIFSLPFLPLFGLAYGIREAAGVIPQLARRFSVSLRLGLQGI